MWGRFFSIFWKVPGGTSKKHFMDMYLFHQRDSQPKSGTLLRKKSGKDGEFLTRSVGNGEIVKEEGKASNGSIEVSTQDNVKGFLREQYLFPAAFVHNRSRPPNHTLLRSAPNVSQTWVASKNNQIVNGKYISTTTE